MRSERARPGSVHRAHRHARAEYDQQPDAQHRLQRSSSESVQVTPASVELSTTAISFGNVATHTTTTRWVVANTGGRPLDLGHCARKIEGHGAFTAGLPSCGATLAAGGSCLAEVTFTPTTTGTFNGTLTFTSNLANSPHQVSLVGPAFNPVSLAAAPLPDAKVDQAYSYDFKFLLGESNETSPGKSLATWTGSGTLPTGLSFNTSTGVLLGMLVAANAGAAYTVTGTLQEQLGAAGLHPEGGRGSAGGGTGPWARTDSSCSRCACNCGSVSCGAWCASSP